MIHENHYPALLLNADYSPVSVFPLSTITWQDALKNLFLDKLVSVAEYEVEVSSAHSKFRLPSVVALKKYQKQKHAVAFSRSNIWLRDGGRCVYCQRDLATNEITFDHVYPKSRGGDASWSNIVCACMSCNTAKANRTPKECKMFPVPAPRIPTQFELARAAKKLVKSSPTPKHWRDFIYWDGELDAD